METVGEDGVTEREFVGLKSTEIKAGVVDKASAELLVLCCFYLSLSKSACIYLFILFFVNLVHIIK